MSQSNDNDGCANGLLVVLLIPLMFLGSSAYENLRCDVDALQYGVETHSVGWFGGGPDCFVEVHGEDIKIDEYLVSKRVADLT